MKFTKLVIDLITRSYYYRNASDIKMILIGRFLQTRLGFSSFSFKKWFHNDKSLILSNKLIRIKKEDTCIILNFTYEKEDEEPSPEFKIPYEQFLQLLDNWQNKVVNQKPREVIITYENNKFIFKTSFEWSGIKFLKLILTPSKRYKCADWSDSEMSILSYFLLSDVGPRMSSFFIDWLNNDNFSYTSYNVTELYKEGNYILLSELYSEEEEPTVFRIIRDQFEKILKDWEQKVIKLEPTEVVIKYENNEFIFETSFEA